MEMKNGKIMSTLVHISTNMWKDIDSTKADGDNTWERAGSDTLRLDREVWDKYTDDLRAAGNNTLVLDLGDGILYKSHPEIAVKGAWTVEELKAEIKRLRDMGFELIPKLNFSTTHDCWMKDYSRMVSSAPYYKFCSELIAEICEIFEPRYFHIGMDEECYEMQRSYEHAVVRSRELWWHDLKFYASEVERHGARAIMFADYARYHLDDYIENCPRSIIPMVWYYEEEYYGEMTEAHRIRVVPYKALTEAGFDIMSAGSVWLFDDNLVWLAEYCKNNINQDKFIGTMQTTWQAVTPEWSDWHKRGIESCRRAVEEFNS